jgi:serine/threonine-protein kinase HipA
MTSAEIHLYDTLIGAVAWDDSRDVGIFEYDPAFLHSGIEISPITLPLRTGRF